MLHAGIWMAKSFVVTHVVLLDILIQPLTIKWSCYLVFVYHSRSFNDGIEPKASDESFENIDQFIITIHLVVVKLVGMSNPCSQNPPKNSL